MTPRSHRSEGQALRAKPDDSEGQALRALPDDSEGQALRAKPDDSEGQALRALPFLQTRQAASHAVARAAARCAQARVSSDGTPTLASKLRLSGAQLRIFDWQVACIESSRSAEPSERTAVPAPPGSEQLRGRSDKLECVANETRHRRSLPRRIEPVSGVTRRARTQRGCLTPRGALICSRCPKRLKFQQLSSPRRDASDALGRHRGWREIRSSGVRVGLRVRTESGLCARSPRVAARGRCARNGEAADR